ncbi:MAG: peptide chain release factor N(5)-glutamine methyltransferase [Actinobacteria bacterium]|nr:peptide chain release factor N(5)-glutamine methyltransferase [Actinomycetota bacterium]
MTAVALMDVVRAHAATLASAGVERPEVDALMLARHALDADVATVRTATTADVDDHRLRQLADLVAVRATRVPLQHLTATTGFRGLDITCRAGVFIPRPETEILAGLAIEAARRAAGDGGRATVLEPCTGAGAVALAVATEVHAVDVVATDRCARAVAAARHNFARVERGVHRAGNTCRVVHGDLFAPVPADLRGTVDLVVCNPPYLTPGEVAQAPPEVRDHEPRDALVAGAGGNAVVHRLLDEAPAWLRPGGHLLVELAETRAGAVAAAARRRGYTDVRVVADLTGRDRVLVARRPQDPT